MKSTQFVLASIAVGSLVGCGLDTSSTSSTKDFWNENESPYELLYLDQDQAHYAKCDNQEEIEKRCPASEHKKLDKDDYQSRYVRLNDLSRWGIDASKMHEQEYISFLIGKEGVFQKELSKISVRVNEIVAELTVASENPSAYCSLYPNCLVRVTLLQQEAKRLIEVDFKVVTQGISRATVVFLNLYTLRLSSGLDEQTPQFSFSLAERKSFILDTLKVCDNKESASGGYMALEARASDRVFYPFSKPGAGPIPHKAYSDEELKNVLKSECSDQKSSSSVKLSIAGSEMIFDKIYRIENLAAKIQNLKPQLNQ